MAEKEAHMKEEAVQVIKEKETPHNPNSNSNPSTLIGRFCRVASVLEKLGK